MPRHAPTRLVPALGLLLACIVSAAAQPPASHAVSQPASSLPSLAPTVPAPSTPAQQEPKHAQVTYANGILSISADNSSLNQILRQVSQETGMKITGGVAEQRVFGHYGPAAPSEVLATLLDGAGSNMLLLHRQGATPAELVLTPRLGGPTPPNPNASTFDSRPEPEESSEAPEPHELPERPHRPGVPVQATPASAAGQTPSDEPQSPNGVKTPQQIYEQLMRMRQQQASSPQATPQ